MTIMKCLIAVKTKTGTLVISWLASTDRQCYRPGSSPGVRLFNFFYFCYFRL